MEQVTDWHRKTAAGIAGASASLGKIRAAFTDADVRRATEVRLLGAAVRFAANDEPDNTSQPERRA